MDSDEQARPSAADEIDPPYRAGIDAGDAANHSDSLANGTATTFAGVLAPGTPRWNSFAGVGTSVNITYAFRDAAPTGYPASDNGDPTTSFAALSTAARNEVRTLINYVGSVTGVHFTEVADSAFATIQIGSFTFVGGSAGYAYYPSGSPTSPNGLAGDIWIDRSQTTKVGPGSYFDLLFIHELGHALGLKHPFDGTTSQQLTSALDVEQYTVMTYQNFGDLTKNLVPTWNGSSVSTTWLYRSTYSLFDLEALTYLYGSGTTAHAGDDTYKFDSTAVMTTIADRGGHDTIDASNLDLPSTIDLRPGATSSIGVRGLTDWLNILAAQGMPASSRTSASNFLSQYSTELYTGTNDLSINSDATIEDAIGGRGNDTIYGNSADNHLTGGAGNDVLNGDSGIDTGYWTLAFSNYSISKAGTVTTVKANAGTDGTDTVSGVERLRFSDGVVLLDQGANGPAAFRLYQAAFARSPDEAGLKVQIHALDTGTSLLQLARNFIGSGEFVAKYGNPDNAGYATAMYRNVLGRDPDAGGLKVQVDALNSGLARDQLLVNFSESAENLTLTAPKTVVGLYVTFIDAAYG
jgi:serralysin